MEENNQVAVVEKALPILQSLPEQLTKHQASVSGAEKAVSDLLAAFPDGIKNSEQDARVEAMIVKVRKTKEKLEDARKAGTQMMTLIAKSFTELEGKLDPAKKDSLPARLQTLRNDYVKWLADEKKRIDAENELIKNRTIESGTLRAEMIRYINTLLNNWLFRRKNDMEIAFAAITLENFEEKAANIKNLSTYANANKMAIELSPYQVKTWPAKYLQEGAVVAMQEDVFKTFNFEEFEKMYETEFTEMKQRFIDRLPSKKQELDQAEKNRLQQIRLKAEQEKEQDELKKKQLQEQQDRAAQEQEQAERDKQQRLLDEQQRNEELKKQKEESDRQAAELLKTQATAQSLFEQSTAASLMEKEPQTKSGYDIEVKSAAGWALIFQSWFMNVGIKLPLDKFGGTKLESMKTFCEKEAIKNDTKIESEFLVYHEVFTAVNKAVKKKD